MTRYADPYLAGVGLGLVLLSSYGIVGHGVGASGGFASLVAGATVGVEGAARASASPAVNPYLVQGRFDPLHDWFLLELVGMGIGGACSAWLAGRWRVANWHGPRVGGSTRILTALGGGTLMGVGAKLARGCTSGQALTGGALLSVGSWIFIATCFGAAYLTAPFARRLWR